MIPGDVIVSRHAYARWAERFPNEDLQAAMDRASPMPTPRLQTWAKATRYPKFTLMGLRGWYDPITEALFLVREEYGFQPAVVTAIPFRKPAKTRRRRLPSDRAAPRERLTANILND